MPPHVLCPFHTYISRLASLDICVSRMYSSFTPKRYRYRVVISRSQGCCCERRSAVASISYSDRDFSMSTVASPLTSILIISQWQSLITHRGPYDPCNGLQLVLAALLGQVYAALSKVSSCARIEYFERHRKYSILLASPGQGTVACTTTTHSR
jgi:hypothetical protein